MKSQSQHYEQAAASLNGADKERALRAAQNALQQTAPTYMADFKRLQGKLIACLEAAPTSGNRSICGNPANGEPCTNPNEAECSDCLALPPSQETTP